MNKYHKRISAAQARAIDTFAKNIKPITKSYKLFNRGTSDKTHQVCYTKAARRQIRSNYEGLSNSELKIKILGLSIQRKALLFRKLRDHFGNTDFTGHEFGVKVKVGRIFKEQKKARKAKIYNLYLKERNEEYLKSHPGSV